MITTETHFVPKRSSPTRLQEYGVGIFDAYPTKSALKKALKKHYVFVNGVLATSATYINGGETITLTIPKNTNPKKRLNLKLKVLFEDDYLAIIHKPAGILVSGNHFKTIVNALDQNLKLSTQADATQPQPVHRLDFATKGVLLIGKTSSAIRALNKQFESKNIEKTYFAVTIGNMKKKGIICTNVDNKTSKSEYLVKQSVPSKRFNTLNLVKLRPLTGRRHQLRIHLSGIGHPILGDKDYGKVGLILNGKGMYLHAYALKFRHPISNEIVTFKSELPKNFKKIFN